MSYIRRTGDYQAPRSTRPACATPGCKGKATRYSDTCSKCINARIEAAQAAARAVAATGTCPQCGGPIRHNLAISGWIQCAQFGAESFRADPAKPACDYQAFTQ